MSRLPLAGALAVTGYGIYEMLNSLLGNQTEAAMIGSTTTDAASVQFKLDAQRRDFDRQLQVEHDRQNARDVAAAYARGLQEMQAKLAAAAAASTPAPPAREPLTFQEQIAAGIIKLPPPTLKQKIAAGWSKAIASPLFLPLFGVALARLSSSLQSSSSPPFEEFAPEPLTGFQEGPVEFLGGQLGGIDPELFAEPDAAEATSEDCEKVTPKRTPGECRQGWFAETPTQMVLKEWSRRPCQ